MVPRASMVQIALVSMLAATAAASGQQADDGRRMVSASELESDVGPNVGTQPRPPRPIAAAGEAEPSRFHLTAGADWTNAYFGRGILAEKSGLIVQPYAAAALDVIRLDAATISFTLGTWNSFHGRATAAGTSDGFVKDWYECDLYAGVGVETGTLSLAARYYADSSPSDAFGTIEEVYLSAAWDDSKLLGAWALSPTAVVAVETGAHAADGGRNGAYIELGVSPGFSFDAGRLKEIAVSFPVSIGLSLSNYYEGANGENDAFGYASIGAKASIPLEFGASWGAWKFNAGVQGLFLGQAAASWNDGRHAEVIGTIGVSAEF